MFLLDTNVLAELAKPQPDLAVSRRIHGTEPDRLFASEMSRYEIHYGAMLHARSEELWEKVMRKVIPLPIWLPIDDGVSLATGELDAELRRRGTPIGLVHTFLAATALTYQLVMVTRNVQRFAGVPGLTIENWFPEEAR
jgi:predicted nucleic acid-binding protein